ncbi:MAG: hypothetical protein OEZ06_27160 [Myxococcales bacterium]|nr:hypothetical protein [Myxococcales bacterium]
MATSRWILVLAAALALAIGCSDETADEGVAVGPAATSTDPGNLGSTPNASGQVGNDAPATAAAAGAPAPAMEEAMVPVADDPMVVATDPVADDAITAGRSVAPEGVLCTAAASSRVPCHDDPNPCGIDSGFPGDEYCLPPPPPGTGIQIHFGPDDYNDPAQINEYVLTAGLEVNEYGVADIPTTEDNFYNFVQLRMRPNSHHLINSVVSRQDSEGFVSGFGCPGTTLADYFVGSQNPVRDDPANGVVAPENEGLGRLLPGNGSLCINQHAYNFGEEPVLREVWINVYFMDPSEVTQQEERIVVNVPVGRIAPGAAVKLEGSATANGDGRLLNLIGHRHAWTDRFAVWHNERLIYDSWDWVESVVFDYNSVTQNPPIATEQKIDGAVSGVVEVKDGDTISVLCDVNNQSDNTLTFSNEALTGEMCILFGASVGTKIGGSLGF